MRIAYFTDTFSPEVNGVTNTLSRMRAYLEKSGVQYAFFTPAYGAGGQAGEETAPQDGGIHRFGGLKTALSPESRLAFPRTGEIVEICNRFNPDLVHVVTELGIGYRGLKYALSRNLPLVMSYHTDYSKYLQFFHLDFCRPLLEKYLAWFYRSAHRVLAPSKHTLEQLFHKGYQNLGIWSRGIDTDTFNPRYRSRELRRRLGVDDRFVFLYVGRLSPEKGLDTLLYAITEIERRFPGRAAFVFTGGGPCAALIAQKNYPNVILTGFKTGRELSEIYASCDCFAFPSGTETFGNAPLEAMASGLPVAAIAGGGVLDFLSHGQNALLSADGDREAFTGALVTIMQDRKLRRALAERGRRTARSRAWDVIFDDLLGVYAGLIESNRNAVGSGYRDAS
ncbi:MAG: glycosyltransferase family 1 protein [Spirochaetaceae bacterium]|jgi:glycosyltransferase involved in cell wall biosynthesis|nr:glycosyltransferase family 1 protein [Spirochaetaceae bacterium]